jgi:hypothetical protein
MPPWIGPGRTIATSITRSSYVRGFRRGSIDICARLSIWNTPTVSASQIMSNTFGSLLGTWCIRTIEPRQRFMWSSPAADRAEHAEREHVDLEHAHGLEVVLLPLDDGAVFHRGLLDRHQPREPGVREHEAAHVLAQVAREALEPLRHLDPLHELELVFLHAGALARGVQLLAEQGVVEPVMVFREFVDQPLVDAQRLAHVAQRAARAVADDDRRDGRALAAVLS